MAKNNAPQNVLPRMAALTAPFMARHGFSLLELVIVLGITGIIFGGLWGLLSGGNSQLQAQTAAQQYRQVLEAVKKYAATDSSFTTADDGTTVTVTIAQLQTANLLPSTFTGTDPFGNSINVRVRVDNDANGRYRILVYGGTGVADKTGAQASSLIGAEGGFVYSQPTDGCAATSALAQITACGAYNSFALPLNSGAFVLGASQTGRLVAYAYTGDSNTGTAPYLYRKPGYTDEQRTMQDNMFFNGTSTLSMSGSAILMGGGVLNTGAGSAATTGGGEIRTAAADIVTSGGDIFLGGGTLDMGSGTIASASLISGRDIELRASIGNVVLDAATTVSVPANADGSTVLDVNGPATFKKIEATQFIYSSSDEALKENIRPIANALEGVLKLRGVRYDWRGSHEESFGVIAQEVERVFPEAVGRIGAEVKGVDYGRLVAPMIEAIRELKMQNDDLRREVEALKKKDAARK